jgi:hypothetical protein
MATGRGTPWSLWYKPDVPLLYGDEMKRVDRNATRVVSRGSGEDFGLTSGLYHKLHGVPRPVAMIVEPARGVLVLVALLC